MTYKTKSLILIFDFLLTKKEYKLKLNIYEWTLFMKKEIEMSKIGKVLAGLGGVLITGAIGGYLAYLIYKELHFISTDAAFLQADIIDVSPTATGGKIEKLYFNEFQKIKKGDLLAV